MTPASSPSLIDQLSKTTLGKFFGLTHTQEVHQNLNLDVKEKQTWSEWFFQAPSSYQSLSWKKIFNKESDQQKGFKFNDLEQSGSCLTQTQSCFFEKLEEVQLSCKDLTHWQHSLRSLTQNYVPFGSCELLFKETDNTQHTHNIEQLLINAKNQYTQAERVKLIAILNYLTTGEYSPEIAKKMIQYEDFNLLQDLLAYPKFKELSRNGLGEYSATYEALSKVNATIINLFKPAAEVPSSEKTFWLKTKCQESFNKNAEDHIDIKHEIIQGTLKNPSSLYDLKFTHFPEKTIITSSDPKVTQSWADTFVTKELVSASKNSTAVLPNGDSIFKANYQRRIFKPVEKSDILLAFLAPLGFVVTCSGLYYIKKNYEDIEKPTLRKSVGMVAGLGLAILGMMIVAAPYGAYDDWI